MKKRILSILLLCCMVLTMLPAPAFAADEEAYALPPDTGGLCEHHPEHDEACGYTPQTEDVAGTPCGHVCENRESEDGSADPAGPTGASSAAMPMPLLGAVRPAATQYTYTLHYDANGGSGAPPSQSMTSPNLQVSFLISDKIPTRDGYTFKGWADSPYGEPKYLRADGYHWYCNVVNGQTNSTTIYAIWEVHNHSWGEWTSNGNGTHKRTCITDSSHTETGNCSGGKATGTEKAICDTCHTAYGELLPLTKTVITTPPTLPSEGYVGEWYLDGDLKGGEAKAQGTDTVVPGSFRFKHNWGGRVYPGENRMEILFTPDDAETYATAECIVTVTGIKYTITSVIEVDLPDKPLGTAFEDLWPLPPDVAVKTNTGRTFFPIPVTWDSSSYDPNAPGEQIITGQLHVEESRYEDKLEPASTVKAIAKITLIGDESIVPTLEPPTYSRQIYSGDFCQLAFSDEYLSGGKATANGETVDGVFTLNEEQEKYGYWNRGGGLVQVGPLALKVTFTPDDLLKYTTAECTVNVDVIPRKFRQANTSYIDNKKIGTAFEDLGLPNAFYFFAEVDEPNHEGSGLNGNVPGIIKWDDSNYDPNSYEEQTIYGTVNRAEFEKYYIVPEGADLRGVVKITLQADPVDTEIAQPPVFQWKNGDFTLPDNTMFVNRIFEMGATGGGSANLADGVAKVKGTDTVVPGTFSFQEGTPGWFDELGENVVTVVFTPTDQHSYRTAETTIKVNVIKNTFKRCEEPDPITEKRLGTTFAGLNLPKIVVVEAIDGLRVGMEVSWDESSYDAQSTAWQTIPGTLVFDANDEHRYQQPEPAVTAAIRVKLLGSEDAPAITTTTLPGGTVGTPYHHQLQATGGGFILWELFSGELPDGLTLKQTTGEISGTPTAVGTATFTVKAENSVGSDTKDLSITIAKPQQYGKVSMDDYVYGETPSTPSLTDRTGNGSVTYYYTTTNSNSGGTKWENIQADTLNAGTYYMYAELGETENYGSFTTACVKFRVLRAMPTCTKPTGLTAIYGQTLADVTLPDGWSWMNSSESVGGASTAAKKFMAKFTPADTTNYNTVEDIELEVTVNKANQAPLTIQGADGVVYGQTLALTTTGGSGTGTVTYRIDTDASTGEATIDPETGVLTPVKVGSVSVIATKAGDNDYNDVTSAPFVLMIKPATPTGEPNYTKITTSGKTLKDAALTTKGSTLNPSDGKLEWVDDKGNVLPDSTRVEANTTYKWHFTPTDTNYTTLTGEIELYRKSSSGGGGWYYSYYTIKATAGAGGSISPSGNVSVREGRDQTFTITPDKGYAVANVKIDGKSIGAVKSYTFENVRRTHTIEVIFMKANGNPQTGVFVDVATGSYYEDAVDWAVENGITTGVSANRFDPNGVCTRAQAVTFLWRAAGSPAPRSRTMPFTDVPAGNYYYDAVLWAVENGITKGTSDTTFSPNMTCTRAQIVAFLWRSEKAPAAGSRNPFADVKSSAYYADAVLWALREDITKGTTSTTFSPDADCTRAQIVTFLWRCKK
ncbi:MAG: S-layer homology domain-containing protein [Oscillospiraceae bacterium]